MANKAKQTKLKITLVKGTIKCKKNQIATVQALGLKRIGSSVEQDDNPAIRGMIRKVNFLLCVEEVQG